MSRICGRPARSFGNWWASISRLIDAPTNAWLLEDESDQRRGDGAGPAPQPIPLPGASRSRSGAPGAALAHALREALHHREGGGEHEAEHGRGSSRRRSAPSATRARAGPRREHRGLVPKTKETTVIRIGRKRRREASIAASTTERPDSRCSFANSTIGIAFFEMSAMAAAVPIWV